MRYQQFASLRGQFPRWRRSRKRLSACSVLRCPDLWLQRFGATPSWKLTPRPRSKNEKRTAGSAWETWTVAACWRCTFYPCKARSRFLVNFWNCTILLWTHCIAPMLIWLKLRLLYKTCSIFSRAVISILYALKSHVYSNFHLNWLVECVTANKTVFYYEVSHLVVTRLCMRGLWSYCFTYFIALCMCTFTFNICLT
jgi:hypothetical protein